MKSRRDAELSSLAQGIQQGPKPEHPHPDGGRLLTSSSSEAPFRGPGPELLWEHTALQWPDDCFSEDQLHCAFTQLTDFTQLFFFLSG